MAVNLSSMAELDYQFILNLANQAVILAETFLQRNLDLPY